MSIVYISGIPKTYTREDIRGLVHIFNPSRKIKIMNKDNKISATVKFSDQNKACEAIKLLHDREIEGNKLYATVCGRSYY